MFGIFWGAFPALSGYMIRAIFPLHPNLWGFVPCIYTVIQVGSQHGKPRSGILVKDYMWLADPWLENDPPMIAGIASDSSQLYSGWWFGTFFYFPFHIWDVILPIDFHSIFFQRGRRKTTNQILLTIINHIITINIINHY